MLDLLEHKIIKFVNLKHSKTLSQENQDIHFKNLIVS